MSGVKALVAALALVLVAPAEMRITSASNVRLRATPSTDATVIAELPLGTVTTVIESVRTGADRWSRVETADRQRGWLVARLTSPFDPSRPLDAIESIIRDRLQSWSGDTVRWNFRGRSFAASEQLVALIERTEAQLTDVEQRGRFALYRLRALDAALARITEKLSAADPIRTWLQQHEGVAVPSLGGGPILSSDYIA